MSHSNDVMFFIIINKKGTGNNDDVVNIIILNLRSQISIIYFIVVINNLGCKSFVLFFFFIGIMNIEKLIKSKIDRFSVWNAQLYVHNLSLGSLLILTIDLYDFEPRYLVLKYILYQRYVVRSYSTIPVFSLQKKIYNHFLERRTIFENVGIVFF